MYEYSDNSVNILKKFARANYTRANAAQERKGNIMKNTNAKNNATMNNAAAKNAAAEKAAAVIAKNAPAAAAEKNAAPAAPADEKEFARANSPAPAAPAPAANAAPTFAIAKRAAIYNVDLDANADEYAAVVAVRDAMERARTSKLELAYKCYMLKTTTNDMVYGVSYTSFMRSYFGLAKSTAAEYAAAGALVVYDGGAGYHSKYVTSSAFGDFSTKVLVLASRNLAVFNAAVAAGAITPYTSYRDVCNIIKAANDKGENAAVVAAEKAAANAAAEEKARAAAAAEEKEEARKNAAAARKSERYNAADVVLYHESLDALAAAIGENAAAVAALENVRAIVARMTGLK